jgi:hypothetical protein
MAQRYELKLTMDNGSQISAGTIDIPDGPTGPSGAPGEDALFCKKAYEANTEPTVDTTITQATSYFSRTPVVGDNVIIIADGNAINEGKCWIMSCEVTNVNSTTTTLYINAIVATTVPAIPMYRHVITGSIHDESGTNANLMMSVISNVGTQASSWDKVGDVLMLTTNGITSVPGRVIMNSTYYTIQLLRRLSDRIEIETSADGTMKKFLILSVSSLMDIVTTL